MSEAKFTQGPWSAFRMVHAETGEDMTPEQLGEYVKNAVLVSPDVTEFLFVSAEKDGVQYDVCHVGNGPDRAHNAALIQAAPAMHDALASIAEYWNGDRNEMAMADALEYIVNLATETATKARGQS